MRKILPILVSIFIVITFGFIANYYLIQDDEVLDVKEKDFELKGEFNKSFTCKHKPLFLNRFGRADIYIDLSQRKRKGLLFWVGKKGFVYDKDWAKFDYLGTYTLDRQGNLFLTPNPLISIDKNTFEEQKWIYKLDTKSAELSRWLKLNDVKPSGENPYGVISIDFDCDDNSLWVSAIDKSSYQSERGRVYKIDIKNKKILKVYKGFDLLTVRVVKTTKEKYLLAGSAMKPVVYAWKIKNGELVGSPREMMKLPNNSLRVRKIHPISKEKIKLEAIPFSYTLIAQSSNEYRKYFMATWSKERDKWIIKKQESR